MTAGELQRDEGTVVASADEDPPPKNFERALATGRERLGGREAQEAFHGDGLFSAPGLWS